MSAIEKFIIFVASLLLVFGFIGFVYFTNTTAKESGNKAVSDIAKLNTQIEESDYTDYDGTTVTGAEVINIIKRFSMNEICISVDGTSYIYTDTSLATPQTPEELSNAIKDAKTKSNGKYINPGSKYIGKVVRNENTDAIVGLTFTKQ